MDSPACMVCGGPMHLQIQEHPWGQSQHWKCNDRGIHSTVMEIPKKWWGATIQHILFRGWRHDIINLVERNKAKHLALHTTLEQIQ